MNWLMIFSVVIVVGAVWVVGGVNNGDFDPVAATIVGIFPIALIGVGGVAHD